MTHKKKSSLIQLSLFGLMTLTGCTVRGSRTGKTSGTGTDSKNDNYKVVETVSGEAGANYLLGVFGPSEQSVYDQARKRMTEKAGELGGKKGLFNVSTDARYANFLLWSQKKVAMSGDVVEFSKTGSEIAALENDLSETKRQKEALSKKLEELEKKIAGLTSRNAVAAQKSGALESELRQKQADASNRIAALTKEKADCLEKLGWLEEKMKDKLAEDAQRIIDLKKENADFQKLSSQLKDEIAEGKVKLSRKKGILTVYLPNKILFDSGSAVIKPEGKRILAKVSKVLTKIIDKDIRIEGHTDSDRIHGLLARKYPTNWELSTARATAVVRYLVEKNQVAPRSIFAVGYGEFRPAVSNETPEGKSRNRRIEIALIPKEKP